MIGGLTVVSDGGMRASDRDREKVVEVLRDAYTEGRLTLDEFDDRTTAAYAAKTWGDLLDLTSDLPSGVNLVDPSPVLRPAVPQIQDSAPPPQPARRAVILPFLPLAFVALIVATSAHAAVLFIPAIIMLLVWRSHRHGRGPGQGPRSGFPPGPGGDVPPRAGGVPPRTGSGPA